MAYDEALAERIRPLVEARGDVTERKMFGGVAWMLQGNMACGVIGDDLCVRMTPEDADRALAGTHPASPPAGTPGRGGAPPPTAPAGGAATRGRASRSSSRRWCRRPTAR